jgi:hypothetical protein
VYFFRLLIHALAQHNHTVMRRTQFRNLYCLRSTLFKMEKSKTNGDVR